MKRRDFITLLGGAAAWPLAVRAQQPERARRIGVLMPESEDKPESQARAVAFERRLQELGWMPGRNLQIDYRWGMGEVEKARAATADLLKLTPSVLIAVASPATAAMQRTTRTIPIVFVAVSEPVAQGFVASLAHPGGNLTGSPTWSRPLERSGWTCSRKSRRISRAPHSCSTRRRPLKPHYFFGQWRQPHRSLQ